MAPRVVDRLWSLAAALGVTVVVLAVLAPLAGIRAGYVSSGSMRPTLEVGSLLLTHRTAVGDVRPGEVVAVDSRSGGRVVHRVVARGVDGLVLRGDANREPDPAPYDVAVADRVLVSVPGLGWPAAWAGGLPWWALGGGFVGLALLGWRPQRPAGAPAEAA